MSIQGSSDVERRIKELNAGWYNVVNEALKLDASSFLLAQGTLGLQASDSSGLLLMSDAAPPSASVTYFDSGGMKLRSQAFGALLQALVPEEGTSLQTVLEDKYTKWIEARSAWAKQLPHKGTQEQLFKEWAEGELDPGAAQRALSTYKAATLIPLNLAYEAYAAPGATQTFLTPNNTPYTLYVYSPSVAAARQALAISHPISLHFDSSTMSTTLKHITAEGAASGFYEIFSGGAGASFDQLNTTATSSEFTVTGRIGANGTLAVHAGNWFNSWELGRAFGAPDDYKVWSQAPNASGWDAFFDKETGALTRRVTQLVLVSDYSITVTSKASYSKEEYEQIKAHASFGMWPFFSASASTTVEKDYQWGEDGSVSFTRTLPKGVIEIWGVTVAELPN